jgi:hypothetical protein
MFQAAPQQQLYAGSRPLPSPTKRLRRVLIQIAPVFFLFLVVLFFTEPAYLGDTARYISEIQNHRAHLFTASQDPFWDFGHPVWRPLVNTLFDWTGNAIETRRGGTEFQAMAWLMIAINIVATGAAVILLWIFLKSHSNAWAASIATAAFLCTNAVLDYSRSGAPYIPALACLLLSLCLMRRASTDHHPAIAAFAGLSLGASVVFWFPFVLAVPAALLYAAHQFKAPPIRARVQLAAAVVLFCGLAVALTYGVVIHKRQIHSFAQLKAWITSSRNSVTQTDKLKRAVSGLPRSFIDLGDDTLLLKRYVFHDPYTHVDLVHILSATGTIKLILFYIYAGALVFLLGRKPGGRRILSLLAAAAVPVLVFAVVLFEPGGTEKYMPAYPFFFLAVAWALLIGDRRNPAVWIMSAFLIEVICLGNIYAKEDSHRTGAYRAYLARMDALDSRAHPDSMIAVINFWDPLYRVPALRLLDTQAQPRNLWVYDVIEVASARVFHWRREFARDALARWSQGKQVWISSRLLADRPSPEWKWVEGDTGRIKWTALTEFFRSFDIQARVGASDGFVLLANDPRNTGRLREFAAGAH